MNYFSCTRKMAVYKGGRKGNSMNQLALQLKISDIVAEYEKKLEELPSQVSNFVQAGENLKMASVIGGLLYGFIVFSIR